MFSHHNQPFQLPLYISSYRLEVDTIKIPANYENDTQVLNLSNNNLLVLNPCALVRFTNLLKLYMNNNSHYDFPTSGAEDEAFLVHNYLQFFYCVGCSISTIGRYTFSKLPYISDIDLESNRIHSIDIDAFEHNKFLFSLNLRNNSIKHVNDHNFLRHMKYLGYLYLGGNKEFNFNGRLTEKLDNLKVFECSNCSISEACHNIMETYQFLKILLLPSNNIHYFNCFMESTITKLDLSNNPTKHLAVRSKCLKKLYCNNCHLHTVNNNTFTNAYSSSIQELEFSNNSIHSFDTTTLNNMPQLKALALDRNRIEKLAPNILDILPNLTTLCLDGNPFVPSVEITKLKNDYFAKRHRLRLDCAYQSDYRFEEELPNIFDPLDNVLVKSRVKKYQKAIHVVDFSRSSIVYLDPGYFWPNARHVDLSYNHKLNLHRDNVFINHNQISFLNLSHCGITYIYKQSFSKMSNLNVLDLSYNQIESIENYSFYNTNVHVLLLDYNNLRNIESKSLATKFNSLHTLSMDHNEKFDFNESNESQTQMKKESQMFLHLTNLISFSCNGCGITSIHRQTFAKLLELKELSLANNQIDYIEMDAFKLNVKLEYLDLAKNKFHSFSSESLIELKSLCLASSYEKPLLFLYDPENCILPPTIKSDTTTITKSDSATSTRTTLTTTTTSSSATATLCCGIKNDTDVDAQTQNNSHVDQFQTVSTPKPNINIAGFPFNINNKNNNNNNNTKLRKKVKSGSSPTTGGYANFSIIFLFFQFGFILYFHL